MKQNKEKKKREKKEEERYFWVYLISIRISNESDCDWCDTWYILAVHREIMTDTLGSITGFFLPCQIISFVKNLMMRGCFRS